jgi:amino acid transporter
MSSQGKLQGSFKSSDLASSEAGEGRFKKQLSLTDLTFIGLGAIFGSGWLFAASHVSTIAGPAGIISWLIGGVAVLLLGIVYCELGAALPRAGGVVRYPVFSHGPLLGYLMGFVTLIAFSSLIAIEVVAARQYAAAWFPGLTQSGSGNPTALGWLLQAALLCLFFYLNYSSVKTFARANNIISIFKFVVPLSVIVVLFVFFKPQNLTVHGFAPFGLPGIEMAVSAGGVIFAYLGLTPIISVASEVRNPQRTIPIALILSILLSTLIYVLLQLAFIGSIPTAMLADGWHDVSKAFSLPYRDIALTLGVGWLAYMVVADAMISPSGCGNIYMNATPRVIYGWARTGTFFKVFTRVDEASGIPRAGLWLTRVLDPAVPVMGGADQRRVRRAGAQLRGRAGFRRRTAQKCAGHATAIPCQRLFDHRSAVVRGGGADRLLVRLGHGLLAARFADRDVCHLPCVRPPRADPASEPWPAGEIVAVADCVLCADDRGVVLWRFRWQRRARASLRHRCGLAVQPRHLLLGRANGGAVRSSATRFG